MSLCIIIEKTFKDIHAYVINPMEEHNWIYNILILKLCRRCNVMLDICLFRPGNHICRQCRNARVKQYLAEDPTRVEIVRQRALIRGRVKRLKQNPTENNDNIEPTQTEGSHVELSGV